MKTETTECKLRSIKELLEGKDIKIEADIRVTGIIIPVIKAEYKSVSTNILTDIVTGKPSGLAINNNDPLCLDNIDNNKIELSIIPDRARDLLIEGGSIYYRKGSSTIVIRII